MKTKILILIFWAFLATVTITPVVSELNGSEGADRALLWQLLMAVIAFDLLFLVAPFSGSKTLKVVLTFASVFVCIVLLHPFYFTFFGFVVFVVWSGELLELLKKAKDS